MKYSLLILCLSGVFLHSSVLANLSLAFQPIVLPSKADVFLTAVDEATQQIMYTYDLNSDLSAWDLHSKKIIWRRHISDHFELTFAIATSRKSDWIVITSGEEGCLRLLEARTGRERKKLCLEPPLRNQVGNFGNIAVSADDRFIIAGEFSRTTLHLWDANTGQVLTSLDYPLVKLPSPIDPPPAEDFFNYRLYFSEDGARITAINPMVFRLVDLKSKQVLRAFGMGKFLA